MGRAGDPGSCDLFRYRHTLNLMPTGDNQPLIQPSRGRREEGLPPFAVLVFTSQDMELFLQLSPQLHRQARKLYLARLFVGFHQGVPLALVGPMLGAPQAVLVLEKLIALGVMEIISVGWCGSVQKHVRIADLVLPTGAFSEEGTSAHYPLGDRQPGPSRKCLNAIKEALFPEAPTVHEGMVWTTDAPFRETVDKVRQYQQAGALGVDMETSALFTVASFRGVKLTAALVVSDDLSSLKWVHGFKEPTFRQAREELVKSILRAVTSKS
jgi:uridine phosphorylase